MRTYDPTKPTRRYVCELNARGIAAGLDDKQHVDRNDFAQAADHFVIVLGDENIESIWADDE